MTVMVERIPMGIAVVGRLSLMVWALSRPAGADTILLPSEGDYFSLRISGIAHTELPNRLHGFDLTLETADGKLVPGASIVVTGERRYAPNPLPTTPQVRPGRTAGSYRAEGLRFHIPGEWRLHFAITLGDIRDRADLDLMVE